MCSTFTKTVSDNNKKIFNIIAIEDNVPGDTLEVMAKPGGGFTSRFNDKDCDCNI